VIKLPDFKEEECLAIYQDIRSLVTGNFLKTKKVHGIN
jgi:hypothetical protein